jgi:hypothetical protein
LNTGVGKKMAEKIKVYLRTGTIEEAELLRSDEQFRTLSLFNQVFGMFQTNNNEYEFFSSKYLLL